VSDSQSLLTSTLRFIRPSFSRAAIEGDSAGGERTSTLADSLHAVRTCACGASANWLNALDSPDRSTLIAVARRHHNGANKGSAAERWNQRPAAMRALNVARRSAAAHRCRRRPADRSWRPLTPVWTPPRSDAKQPGRRLLFRRRHARPGIRSESGSAGEDGEAT
jgi:hypothetical protein